MCAYRGSRIFLYTQREKTRNTEKVYESDSALWRISVGLLKTSCLTAAIRLKRGGWMSELHLLALILCLLRRAYSDTVFLLFADIFLFSEKVKFLLEKKKKSLEACSCLKQGTRSLIFVHCVDSVQTGKQHLRVRQMYVCCDVR